LGDGKGGAPDICQKTAAKVAEAAFISVAEVMNHRV
jgi:hypothetical protein